MSGPPPRRLPITYFSDSSLIGGAEIVLGHLLGALDPAIDVTVAGTDAEVVAFLAAGRPATATAILPVAGGKRDPFGFARIVQGIAGLGPRIFQANVVGGASCQHALLAATLLPRVRTVVVEQLTVDVDNDMQRRLRGFTNRRLAAHVAPGEGAAREVEALWELPAGSVRAIYNSVPDLALKPVPRVSDGFVVGALGRLHRQKGFDVLVRAIAEVPDASLVLVGDGPEREPLEALAAELGVADRVHLAGWHDSPRNFLASFDVFALPSRFEGFPLSIVEAMLAGLPVISTRVGAIAEAVADGQTGRLVAPEDVAGLTAALRALRDDPDGRAAMGATGRERALAFTPGPMARAFERLYAEIA